MSEIPVAVLELLLRQVNSLDKLDVLVALAAERDRSATLADLVRTTRLPAAVTRHVVSDLETAGIVTLVSGEVRLRPQRRAMLRTIDALILQHDQDRTSVLDVILGRQR